MSRNKEKAQSMLYRFREQQAEELGIIDTGRTRRPKNITSVDSIPQCEKWRAQVNKEIGRKVTKIQDPALSDFQIRDLNDEINKLMKEKHVWEIQLKNLGGPNYLRFGSKSYDENGQELPFTRGYKYFGRARELPGVKDLFDAEAKRHSAKYTQSSRSANSNIPRNLSAAYYGFASEHDTLLSEEEEAKQTEYLRNRVLNAPGPIPGRDVDWTPEGWVPVNPLSRIPTQPEVEQYLIDRRKQTLAEKYQLE